MYRPKGGSKYVAKSYTTKTFRVKGEDINIPVWIQGFRMNVVYNVQKSDGTIAKTDIFYYQGTKDGMDGVVTVSVPSDWYGLPVVGFGIWAIVNPNYPYWGVEPAWSSAHLIQVAGISYQL